MKRVLIVDDQRDIRQLLRDSIQLMGGEIDIVDVPSGEEAMLVITRQHFDLLVSDVRLAGMSGLELVRKLRKRNPGLKVILVTGMTDSEIRQQVSQAGAEAFFFKPVDIAGFQVAVANCLELKNLRMEKPADEAIIEGPAKFDAAIRLENLRDELGAECVFWLGSSGEVLERSGMCPSGVDESRLIHSVMEVEKARAALGSLLGNDSSRDYEVFLGEVYWLHISSTSGGYSLLVLTRTTGGGSKEDAARELMAGTAAALQSDSSGLQPAEVETEVAVLEGPDEESSLGEADLSKLDMVFQGAEENKTSSQDLDAFWDTAAEQTGRGNLDDSESITYEQALRLGIAPKEDSA